MVQIPVTPDSIAPTLRANLTDLLQKEQDEAMSILEANPFLAGLFVKCAEGSAIHETPTSQTSKDKEISDLQNEIPDVSMENELFRDEYYSLLEDQEKTLQQKATAEALSAQYCIQIAGVVSQQSALTEENHSLKK